jgi:NitT/TauT family transport system substrate-binding protein
MGIQNLLKTGAWWIVVAVVLGPSAATAQPMTKVTLRTDFKVNGYVGVFALALERGFYRDQGLAVEIAEGQGSGVTVQTVAAGGDTFGLADSTALMVGVSNRDIPVKAIFVFAQTDIQGLAYYPDSGWDGNIKNMRGKVVISSAGSAEMPHLLAILASAGMTTDDIKLQLVEFNARVPLFLQTPGSFQGAYATGDILRIKSKMPNVGYVPFSKYGVTAYGTGLITRNATIQNDPALVRKFVAASAKGWDVAVKDPEAAIQAALKVFPNVPHDAQQLRSGLKILIDQQLHTPATAGKPIGWTAESDWKAMIDLLQKYSNVKPKPLSAYYTNEFIPNP